MMRSLLLGLLISLVSNIPAQAQYNPGSGSSLSNIAFGLNNYLYNRPTVSPYLNLTRTDTGNLIPNYQSLVRPALDQRERQAQQTAHLARRDPQIARLQQQQIRSQREQQQQQQFTTGHPTRFMAYLHYFPETQRSR